MSYQKTLLLSSSAWLGLVGLSQAAFTFTPDVLAGVASYDSSLSNNLIRSGQSTLGSVTSDQGSYSSGTFSFAGLNDGAASTAANPTVTYYRNVAGNGNLLPVTLTFNLAGSTTGYSITSIQSIAGWGDSNIGDQKFQLLLSVNNGSFVDYGTYTNTSTINNGNFATRTTLSGDTVNGVTAVRFVFLSPGTVQGGAGGTLIRELQVFGTPTIVPEPSAAILIGLGSMTLIGRRRRH